MKSERIGRQIDSIASTALSIFLSIMSGRSRGPQLRVCGPARNLRKSSGTSPWWAHERGRVAAEINPHRQALDLNRMTFVVEAHFLSQAYQLIREYLLNAITAVLAGPAGTKRDHAG